MNCCGLLSQIVGNPRCVAIGFEKVHSFWMNNESDTFEQLLQSLDRAAFQTIFIGMPLHYEIPRYAPLDLFFSHLFIYLLMQYHVEEQKVLIRTFCRFYGRLRATLGDPDLGVGGSFGGICLKVNSLKQGNSLPKHKDILWGLLGESEIR